MSYFFQFVFIATKKEKCHFGRVKYVNSSHKYIIQMNLGGIKRQKKRPTLSKQLPFLIGNFKNRDQIITPNIYTCT